jgi:hypothetical protein
MASGIAITCGESRLPVIHGKDSRNCTGIIPVDHYSIVDLTLWCGLAVRSSTYPNRTPPSATNIPIAMAGHVLPATPAGLLSIKPMTVLNCCFGNEEKGAV